MERKMVEKQNFVTGRSYQFILLFSGMHTKILMNPAKKSQWKDVVV